MHLRFFLVFQRQFTANSYCKFTVESDYERILKSVNIWRNYRQKANCLMCFVRVGTVPLKDEELARDLEYSKNSCC